MQTYDSVHIAVSGVFDGSWTLEFLLVGFEFERRDVWVVKQAGRALHNVPLFAVADSGRFRKFVVKV